MSKKKSGNKNSDRGFVRKSEINKWESQQSKGMTRKSDIDAWEVQEETFPCRHILLQVLVSCLPKQT